MGWFAWGELRMQDVKACRKCMVTMSLSLFAKKKSNKDGLQHNCKSCFNAYEMALRESKRPPKEIIPDGCKKCSSCKSIKPESDYSSAIDYSCRSCRASAMKQARDIRRGWCVVSFDGGGRKACRKCGEIKPVVEFSLEKRSLDGRKYKCKACSSAEKSAWAKARPAHIRGYSQEYRAANPEKWILRSHLSRVIRKIKGEKWGSSAAILGYDSDKLKARLEFQFLPGMSWDNHGEWEVDHRISVASFVNRGVVDPAIINCLSNLKPMWKADNRSKGSKSEARHN